MSMNNPHESVQEVAESAWKNHRPVVIAGAVVVAAIAYALYKKSQAGSAAAVPVDASSSGLGASIVNYYSSTTNSTNGQPTTPMTQPVTTVTAPGGVLVHSPVNVGSPVSSPVARPVQNKPLPVNTYIVQKWPGQGSTLWGIATIKYGNGAQWPLIYNANKSVIGPNPNLLKVGQVLVIPAR